jgi:hypothetical protein
MWVPLPFEKSFRMAYSRTYYGTGYYIYRLYMPGANLSRPIRAWDGKTPPDPARARVAAAFRNRHRTQDRNQAVRPR